MSYKYNVTVHAIFKQENQFLREWLEYHLLVGVEHFFLLNHDDDKTESNKLLQPYIDKDLVTNIPFDDQTGGFQVNGIRKIIEEYGYLTEWMCVIDLDEFIFPIISDNIYDILQQFEKPDINGLYVSCCTFGSSYYKKLPGLVTESLLKKATRKCIANQTAKNFYRPNSFQNKLNKKIKRYMVDENGEHSPHGKYFRPMEKIRVNHYGVRSLEYWKEKVKRSQPGIRKGLHQLTPAIWEHKLILLDQNKFFDDSMLRFVPELKERLK